MAIINETHIIKTLQNYNPWWRNADAINNETKPQKRVAFFEAMKILDHPSIRRFPVLSGARRVGKTTILYQMIESLLARGVSPRNILYASFDNPVIKMAGVNVVFDIFETLRPITNEIYLFFDEIQYAANWELWLKVVYDTRKDVRLTATGSASPIIIKGASDSGAGRWCILKTPTMSFYEYCDILRIAERPQIDVNIRLNNLAKMPKGELAELINGFTPLQSHFNRYITIGGFPELVLANDDSYAQRLLREDVVDKVIKRDVLTMYNIRNPLSMEKLFFYLCINSSNIFNIQTAAKEMDNINVKTIEDYISFLEMSNLIYCSAPVGVGSKAALKSKPKIYIADAAIRNAVLMIDDVLSDEKEMGIMVETAVYKHIAAYYQTAPAVRTGYYRMARDSQKEVDVVISAPYEKILCEVKYRNDSSIPAADAIVALAKEDAGVTSAFVLTKNLTEYGVSRHDTPVPIFRIPALAFIYLIGMAEANGRNQIF